MTDVKAVSVQYYIKVTHVHNLWKQKYAQSGADSPEEDFYYERQEL